MKKIKPVGTKMLVARQEFIYKGALAIPETSKSKTTVGTILAVGPEVTKFSTGQKILFTRMSGILFTVLDETHPRANKNTKEVEFLLMDETEIYAILEEISDGFIASELAQTGKSSLDGFYKE